MISIQYVNNPNKIFGYNVVNDANEALELVKRGETIARFEYGNSMRPILLNGEYGIIHPIKSLDDVNVGDAVFCEVNGYIMTHLVLSISHSAFDSPYFLIGDTENNIFGWTNLIYGVVKGTRMCEEYSKILKYEK